MPINNDLKQVDLPMNLKFGQDPVQTILTILSL